MIDFQYPYDLNINLANLQVELSNKVIPEDVTGVTDKIVGVDVSFSRKDRAVAAAVIIRLKSLEIIEKVTREVELSFPYVSGFLGFREVEAMVSVLSEFKSSFDVIMANGHGILHPRGFGLASHVGLVMDMPTIGLAKRLIPGNYIKRDTSPSNKGNSSIHLVVLGEKIAGAYVNGYYVSVGHKITLHSALKLVKKVSYYKTPEPIRQAHILATQVFKDILKSKVFDMKILGFVISGTKKGGYFISQKFYSEQIEEKLGFKPFPGTLNIQIQEGNLEQIAKIPLEEIGTIKGKGDFGDVKYIKASLNGEINGAIVFPVKTQHPQDILEFIANVNLREHLTLEDGALVSLDIKVIQG